MKPLYLSLLCAALLSTPLYAADTTAWQAAQADFAQAQTGQSGLAEAAALKFQALIDKEPANPLYLAYHGSAAAMQARDTLNPFKKMRFVEDGIADLDRALELLTPTDKQPGPNGLSVAQEVKVTAASTFVALPGFFNRTSAGEKLLNEILGEPQFEKMPPRYRASAHMAAATLAGEKKDKPGQIAQLKLVASMDVPQAAAARSQLNELEK